MSFCLEEAETQLDPDSMETEGTRVAGPIKMTHNRFMHFVVLCGFLLRFIGGVNFMV